MDSVKGTTNEDSTIAGVGDKLITNDRRMRELERENRELREALAEAETNLKRANRVVRDLVGGCGRTEGENGKDSEEEAGSSLVGMVSTQT